MHEVGRGHRLDGLVGEEVNREALDPNEPSRDEEGQRAEVEAAVERERPAGDCPCEPLRCGSFDQRP